MANAARNGKKLPRTQLPRSALELNAKPSLHHQKSLIGVRMKMPGIGLGHRGNPHHMVVDAGNGMIVVSGGRRLGLQRNDIGKGLSHSQSSHSDLGFRSTTIKKSLGGIIRPPPPWKTRVSSPLR